MWINSPITLWMINVTFYYLIKVTYITKNYGWDNYFFAVMFSPFFPHVLEAWAKKDHPNMLFVFYEDLKKVNLKLFY